MESFVVMVSGADGVAIVTVSLSVVLKKQARCSGIGVRAQSAALATLRPRVAAYGLGL
jgi:hypothetical protein